MGYGDKLMALGDAYAGWNADPRKLKVAIGDGARVDWCELSDGLPFLATQNEVDAGAAVNWIISYPSHRPYINYDEMRKRVVKLGKGSKANLQLSSILGGYVWNYKYHAQPATLVFTSEQEDKIEKWEKSPFICIEPYIKDQAPPNKQWPVDRYAAVAKTLSSRIRVVQLSAPGKPDLYKGIERAPKGTFKDALAFLKASKLYIGAEGGLHHGAAAVSTPAVVIFGGFVPPSVTGYKQHINLIGGAKAFCGLRVSCPHCVQIMRSISPNSVVTSALQCL